MALVEEVFSLGAVTDAQISRSIGNVRTGDGYIVLSCPSNPHFQWGNRIHFSTTSLCHDPGRCEDLMRNEFGGVAGIRHFAFSWKVESYRDFPGPLWVSAGYSVELSDVLVMTTAPRLQTSIDRDITVRPLATDSEWKDALECEVLVRSSRWSEEGYREYLTPRFREYRRMVSEERAVWFGAFNEENDQLGNLGIAMCAAPNGRVLARFQRVATHPSYQGQGVCKRLLRGTLNDLFLRVPQELTAVIVADPDYHAKAIYKKVGFLELEHEVILSKSW